MTLINCKTLCMVVAIVATFVSASPLPFNRVAPSPSEALISCNDLLLVQRLEKAAIPFSCIPSSFVVADQDDPSMNEVMTVGDSLSRLRGNSATQNEAEITLVLDAPIHNGEIDITATDCVNPERCSFRVQEFSSSRCPTGHVFVAEIGECIAGTPVRNTQREDFFNPNSEFLNDRPCSEGFIFNLEKGICLPDKKKFSVSSAAVQADEGISSFENPALTIHPDDCDDDSIFVPEVGICLQVTKQQSAEPVAVDVEFPSPKNCPEGTIFNPEVGICLVVEVKPQEGSQEAASEALPLVSNNKPSSSEPQKINTWTETHKCEKGTVYVSEIDRCVLVDQERPQGDSPAQVLSNLETVQKTTLDPLRPTLAPLTAEQIGSSKCPKGKVYVSEIDLCLDP